jgi:hypothetical protein
VNTSVTEIDLSFNGIDTLSSNSVDALLSRNKRLRSLFLFDARQMLLSLMCADECSVVWPYLLGSGDKDGIIAPDNIEAIRAESAGFIDVVAKRRRRLQGTPEAKRRRQ